MSGFSVYGRLKRKIRNLNDNPKKVAGSFAVGSFIGVSPLVGMQVLISLLLSYTFKLNKIAAVTGVLNTNWTKGLMLYPLNYKLGAWMLGIPPSVDISSLLSGNIFRKLFNAGSEVFICLLAGGFVTGILIAFIYYHIILRIMRLTNKNKQISSKVVETRSSTYALVTGASQGLGRAIANELASRKINLLLVSLEGEGLPEFSQELENTYNVDVQYLETDFRDSGAVYTVAGWAMEKASVSILINNAGIGGTKLFERASPEYVDNIIQVNVRTTALLTRLMLPTLIDQKEAFILNVASMASFSPFAYKTVYPASKAFVYSFSRGLHEELKNTNVFVSVIHPGPVKTNADVTARIERQGWKGKLGLMKTERLAYIAVNQLFKRDSLILPGFFNKINWVFMAIVPNAWKLSLLSRCVRKEIPSLAAGSHN